MFRLPLRLGLIGLLAFALVARPLPADDDSPAVEIRGEDGTVLIAAEHIRSYDWATHTLTLAPKIVDELQNRLLKTRRLVGGVPFKIHVGGEAIYSGRFTTLASSASIATPAIVLDLQSLEPKLSPDQLRIQLGYPSDEFFKGEDPRGNERLRTALSAAGKLAKAPADHTEWLAAALKEMQTIKPGMTRAELLNVFAAEGGLSTRMSRRYTYRDCPYIKVEVQFEPVGHPEEKAEQFPEDKITKISTPFLEWSIAD